MIINNALRTQDIFDRLNIQNHPHKTKKKTASVYVSEPPFILRRLVSRVDQCESKGQWIKSIFDLVGLASGSIISFHLLVRITKIKSPQTYLPIPPVESSSLHRVG